MQQNQRPLRGPTFELEQDGQSRELPLLGGFIDQSTLVQVGLVVCLMVSLLGTTVLDVCYDSGSTTGYLLGYFGAALHYFARFLSIPLWLAAWVFASTRAGERVRFDGGRLLPCLLFAGYALVQLALADRERSGASLQRLVSLLSIIVLALPLCSRRGCNLVWLALAAAGVFFFASLLVSGQLISALRGGGFYGQSPETTSRLDLAMDTITSASMMLQCVLGVLLWLLASRRPVRLWLVGIPICLALGGIAILTGSKGPVLAFVLAVVVALIGTGFKQSVYGLLGLGVIAIAAWLGQDILADYGGSARHLAVGFNDESRQSFYRSVMISVPTLFGNGVGSWSTSMGYGSGAYVHDSVLEAYYEMGVIGAGLLLWAIVSVGRQLLLTARREHDAVARFILAYFVYGLVCSLVSGSIFSDTELWLGLILGCTRLGGPRPESEATYSIRPDSEPLLAPPEEHPSSP